MDSEEINEDRQPDAMDVSPLLDAFRAQLTACLEECVQGRKGLFADLAQVGAAEWPEAAQLRELAIALQSILSQADEPSALCNEFLDLCTIHGESDPGESRLARSFLQRIERGEVGTATERDPWPSQTPRRQISRRQTDDGESNAG